MRWRLEQLDKNGIKGWVYDSENPERIFQVFALRGNTIVGSAFASEKRPALAQAGHPTDSCGFSLLPDESPESLVIICLNAFPGGKDLILYSPNKEAIGSLRRAYQSFDADSGEGNSESAKKLAALKLPSLQGMKVLDLGCNEGFFCQHALAQGAKRVVGVDASNWFIEKAKNLVPNYSALEEEGRLSFLHSSWWNIPDERFDLILFLSAIHYETRQKEFLDFLQTRLAPGGVLCLECGVVHQKGKRWVSVARSVDTCRFPTEEMLLHTLLSRYAVRYAGASVMQAGDPIPRSIYLCTAKKPVVLIVRGPSGSGKTVVSNLFGDKDIPVIGTDSFFTNRATLALAGGFPLYECIRKELDGNSLHKAGRLLISNKLVNDFCKEFTASLPLDEPLVCVEGEVFAYAAIFERLTTELQNAGAVAWDVTPADPAQRRRMEETYPAAPQQEGR
ncbi:methyltransferase domain-containing protein [Desulfovibrio sp. OttesenSCG-928-G15]|nr:methyltransferase domain-containing protein [Desulfovibrio sp. OttesenSCG-928-G15]